MFVSSVARVAASASFLCLTSLARARPIREHHTSPAGPPGRTPAGAGLGVPGAPGPTRPPTARPRGPSPSSRRRRKNVEDFTGPRERSDLGFITFDVTADLENIFDWNVKQLFLYLSAEYSTKNNALNQVVLWDKIVLRGDNPKLLLKDMKTKYFFFDDGNGLKGNRNVTLTLSWNVVPNAGILPLVTGSGHVSVPFPDTYEITKSY
ncbi:signal peptidase complex subunit 3 isoform X1 [Monodon monoceros]|uniref:signal peptidase complex subunit 3 isoform X1 n=1 Tax=Monodon monoceros TaxID=40151 RepID=UPI0010F539A6|nr:signal peptidase complex subunit 3 isoform X1 [Monodon monoceros]